MTAHSDSPWLRVWVILRAVDQSQVSEVPLRPDTPRFIAPRVTPWTALATCAASVVLTWFVSSFGHHGAFYVFGPFHVPVLLEWTVGLGVVAVACAGRVVSARRSSSKMRCSIVTVTFLVAACALGAISWRAITSPGEGSNIGAGFLFLASPLLIACLLHLALSAERFARAGQFRYFVSTSVTIWFICLCAYVAIWF